MKNHGIRIIGLASLLFAAMFASGAEIVFKDDFNCYCDVPPQTVFTDACTIGELPPALRHLQLRPKGGKSSSVYAGGMFKLPIKAQLSDYEFSFKFEFPRDSKKAFDIDLFTKGDGDKMKQAKYTFSINTISMELGKGPLVAVGLCHDLDAIRKISETRKKVGSPQDPASAFAP